MRTTVNGARLMIEKKSINGSINNDGGRSSTPLQHCVSRPFPQQLLRTAVSVLQIGQYFNFFPLVFDIIFSTFGFNYATTKRARFEKKSVLFPLHTSQPVHRPRHAMVFYTPSTCLTQINILRLQILCILNIILCVVIRYVIEYRQKITFYKCDDEVGLEF